MPKLTLKTINQQLKSALCRVKVERIGNKLYLRGTLPPKPTSQKSSWYQQRLPLKCNATEEGLKKAKALAFEVSANLDRDSFRWEDWIDYGPKEGMTVAEAVEEFRRQYFTTRKETDTTRNSFKKHYQAYFKLLPQNKPLTKELLVKTIIDRTEPDGYPRRGAYIAYQAIARAVLNEDLNASHLKGSYETEAVDPRDLPTDEQIEETRNYTTRNPNMEACYCLMAIYGLRPSECFWVDQASLQDAKGVIQVLTHKSKGKPYWRLVYPSRLDWLEKWRISELAVPVSEGRTNNHKGATVSKFFQRHPKIPFNAYMLRHAYAARLARKNVDSAIAAKWMGHSNDIHCRIYHKFLDRSHFDEVFEKYVKN